MRRSLIALSLLLLLASGCGSAPSSASPTARIAAPTPEEEWESIIYKHLSQVDEVTE